MSFLTSQVKLSETIFNDLNLEEYRKYIIEEIKKVAPNWLDEPQGIMGEYWKKDDLYAACNLLWITDILVILNGRVTKQSVVRLQEKFKALLFSSSLAKFTETLTELEVAKALVNVVSPLAFEPLVSKEAFSSGNRPAGPDFAFLLPQDIEVFAEATVWHFDLLTKWDKAVDQILTFIQNRLFKQGKTLKVQLQLPLQEFKPEQITKMARHAWSKIALVDSGQLTIIKNGIISWSPYPIASALKDIPLQAFGSSHTEALFRIKFLDDNPAFMNIAFGGVSLSPNVIIDHAFVKQLDVALLSESDIQTANKLAAKSFFNVLKRKREQFPYENQYLLVVKTGHFRLLDNILAGMIEREVWTKKDFGWITGIMLFTPRRGFLLNDSPPQFLITMNPNARCQANNNLKSVLKGEMQFHLNRFTEPS